MPQFKSINTYFFYQAFYHRIIFFFSWTLNGENFHRLQLNVHVHIVTVMTLT